MKASYSGVPGLGGTPFGVPPNHSGASSPTTPPVTLEHEHRRVLVISSAIRRAMPGTIPKMMAGMGTLANANALGSDIRRPHPVAKSYLLNRQNLAAPSG